MRHAGADPARPASAQRRDRRAAPVGRFPGASAVVDSNGAVLARMNDQAGVAVAQIAIDPRRKAASAPACEGELIPDLTKFDWLSAS